MFIYGHGRAYIVEMVVLAVQDSGLLGVGLGNTGDIDEEAVPFINPPSIDDVHPVAPNTLPDPPIDVEQVLAMHLAIVGGVRPRGHVVILAHHGESLGRDLDIQIPIYRLDDVASQKPLTT